MQKLKTRTEKNQKLKMFHKLHTGRRKGQEMPFFVPGDLDLWPSNLSERGTKRLPCEFGANPFSSSRDISYTNKKPQTDGTKNRTFCSSVCVV